MADLTTLLSKFLTGWYAGRVDLTPVLYAALPASPTKGMVAFIADGSTATWGATVTGGSNNNVLVVYNGSAWTVAGK